MGLLGATFEWGKERSEDASMALDKLVALAHSLEGEGTQGFLVIRRDRIVFEWYADGHGRRRPHYTASMAKALVGGVSTAWVLGQGRIGLDDPIAQHVPEWAAHPVKGKITLRQLGSHTSGLQDAWVTEEAVRGVGQGDFSGWEGLFWRWRNGGQRPPDDAFTLARDRAPVLFPPGTDFHYSNPGLAMLGYVVTTGLEGRDIRSLLRDRIMRAIGVPDGEWSCGYGRTEQVGAWPLVATWGGGSYSANATARVARLMLRNGNWEGQQLIKESAVQATIRDAGTPGHGGIGWWTNAHGDLGMAPADAFAGLGAGHQVVFVVPSLDLIVVRNGSQIAPDVEYHTAVRQFLFDPVMEALPDASTFVGTDPRPYPKSDRITQVHWDDASAIRRRATGSDNWPTAWGDDGMLYTAYGDGWGFEPKTEQKLSLGLAQIEGGPEDFTGRNLRSATGEFLGQGAEGKKASGLIMVEGTLYMLVRNAENSQLGWSLDRGASWEWSNWRFSESFGAPGFVGFGPDYQGARDDYVYLVSHDAESAYKPADRMVMARVGKERLRDRSAYRFFAGYDSRGAAIWTDAISNRKAVFSHPGYCYRNGMSYNAGLERYIWCQIYPDTLAGKGPRFEGGFGIYEAPEPWGPWRTVFSTRRWDVGPGETSHFPSKWMSASGEVMHLVFSGEDSFSVRRIRLQVTQP